MEIARSLLDEIRRTLADAYPQEGCGFLLGTRNPDGQVVVGGQRAVPNRRAGEAEAVRRYLIGPEDFRAAEHAAAAAGLIIVGAYHSHPDAPAQPSSFDLEHAWPWYCYLVVSVGHAVPGEARVWELREDRCGFTERELKVQAT